MQISAQITSQPALDSAVQLVDQTDKLTSLRLLLIQDQDRSIPPGRLGEIFNQPTVCVGFFNLDVGKNSFINSLSLPENKHEMGSGLYILNFGGVMINEVSSSRKHGGVMINEVSSSHKHGGVMINEVSSSHKHGGVMINDVPRSRKHGKLMSRLTTPQKSRKKKNSIFVDLCLNSRLFVPCGPCHTTPV